MGSGGGREPPRRRCREGLGVAPPKTDQWYPWNNLEPPFRVRGLMRGWALQ